MSSISAHDPQLARLADAIAQRVGQQRFHVWFNNSTRLDLKNDGLEIAVPNDFISEWIGTHFTRPIQEAAHEVLGCSLAVRFSVVPQLFEVESGADSAANKMTADGKPLRANGNANGNHGHVNGNGPANGNGVATIAKAVQIMRPSVRITSGGEERDASTSAYSSRPRLRHDLENYVVGASNQLAYNTATYVAEFPGAQYNPLFIHGCCGLGKTHLLQGLCKKFIDHHPTKRWMYLTGEEFTNEFLTALRNNKLDNFRRRCATWICW